MSVNLFFWTGLDGENLLDKSKVEEITEYLAEMKEAAFACFLGPQDEVSCTGHCSCKTPLQKQGFKISTHMQSLLANMTIATY